MVATARVLPAVACCLWALFAVRPATPSAPVAASSPRSTNPTGAPNAIQWLVVSPRDPRTLYVGRYACPMVFLRSRDAGRTWRSLLDAAQICIDGSSLGEAGSGNALTGPLQIAADGRSLFLNEFYAPPGSVDQQAYLLLSSTDGGDHWSIPDHGYDQGAGTLYAVLGPPSPRPHGPQFFYTQYGGIGATDYLIAYGDINNPSGHGTDAGAGTPPDSAAGAPGSCCFNAPVPDLRDPTIVYVNLQNNDVPGSPPSGAVRSEHGRAWTVVARPRARPPLRTFCVTTDPHEAGLLVGHTQDPSVLPDRVYLSADHGRTWRAATCPGVLRGSCPAATIDNAFGAGASDAFVGDGLYRFHGGGPATARLPLSARLPVPSRAIAAVAGGTHPGDPVYLTLKGPAGAGATVFYRTLDAGHSWERVAVPNPPLH